MPPEVTADRPRVLHPAAREDLSKPPARRVVARRRLDLHDAPTRLAHPQAEVDVLGAVEVRLVEAADVIEGETPEHLARADREVHGTGAVRGGGHRRVRRRRAE